METKMASPDVQSLVAEIHTMKEFFDRSTRALGEGDSAYKPTPEVRTVVAQVAHVAQTVDWFVEGAFRPQGFSTDWEAMEKEVAQVTSLADARAWWERAVANAVEVIGSKSAAEMCAPLPPGPIMGGLPRSAIVGALADHTAHHRGALTVYARLRGKTPPMPYMDM
jgi:uncharacterized damage-inducible protein DinB